MTNGDGSRQGSMAELEAAINFFYDKFNSKETNHFELLGLAKTATHKEIEAAYKRYSEEFSIERIALIANPDVRRKGDFLINRGKMAYETLIDYKKRAEYEKRGFRDVSPDEKNEDDEERAKLIYKKAKSLKTMKEYAKAARIMEEAIKLDPEKPPYYLLLGLCQSEVPEFKRDAEKNLQKAAEMESWNAEPYAALGMLFYSERLYKRAETYFRRALELEPTHAVARAKLTEIVGPEKKPLEEVQKTLKKFLPSLFDRKK
jgi:tetratricopeptide (TPR) repeat protein